MYFKFMIVVDIETTGLNPEKCSILSIGAVDFLNPTNQFYGECRIFDGAEVTKEALNINGFSYDEIQSLNKKSESELVKEFVSWVNNISNKTFAGHNPHFDFGFLKFAALRANVILPFRSGWFLDLHTLCYAKNIQKGIYLQLSSTDIFNSVGLPKEPNPHNALNGAKFVAEAISRIIHQKNLLDNFKKFPV